MVMERIANPSWLITTAGSNPVLSANMGRGLGPQRSPKPFSGVRLFGDLPYKLRSILCFALSAVQLLVWMICFLEDVVLGNVAGVILLLIVMMYLLMN